MTKSGATHCNQRVAIAIVIAGMLLLAGCAAPGLSREQPPARPNADSSPPAHDTVALWRVTELAQTRQPMVLLHSPQGSYGAIETAMLRRILTAGEKIVTAAGDGQSPELVLIGSRGINAYAFVDGGRPTIAINLGMVRLLAADDDAWAALIGHELAHLRLDHLRGMKDRRGKAELTSSLAAVILSAVGLPFASLATDATTALADRAYSRDDEREADRIGLEYMRKAGVTDAGAIRLQQLLLRTGNAAAIPFLSTHPGGEERIENLRNLMRSGD